MAVNIAAGQEPIPVPFYQPPLYPYFLGLLYALFGRDLFLVRAVQMTMGSASVWLLYLLAGRLFGRRVGFVAALAFALYGTMVFYEGELLAPVLIVFLNLLLALAVMAALDKPSPPRALRGGLLLGLSALAMSVILPLWLVIPAYAWFHWRRKPGRPGFWPGILLAASLQPRCPAGRRPRHLAKLADRPRIRADQHQRRHQFLSQQRQGL